MRFPSLSLLLRLALPLALLAASGCHRDPAVQEAEAIVQKNAAARGGLEAWRRVKAMTLTGKLDAGTPRDPRTLAEAYLRQARTSRAASRHALEAQLARARLETAPDTQVRLPFRLELERPRRSRLEITFRGEKAVQVYDGAQGWKVRPFLGRRSAEPFTPDELAVAAQQTELDGLLIGHEAKKLEVRLLGHEPVDGKDAYKLEVTGDGPPRHVWVDAQTWLDVRVDGRRRVDGRERTVLTTYRDFRPVDGLMVPHQLETTVEGLRGAERIVVEQVALNPDLPAARFARPD